MRYKMTDLYNTRFFYITLRTDLNYLFTTVKCLQADQNYPHNVGNELIGKVYEAAKCGAPIEFDFAGAKITPDIVTLLMHYAAEGFVFVDSKDYWRNEIFKVNRERAAVDTSVFVDLPKYDTNMLVKDYIQSLDKNVKYRIPVVDADIYLPLSVMIMLARPSITLLVNNKALDLFTFVGERLTVSDLFDYKTFYFTSPEGTQVLDFSSGKAYVQRLGEVDLITASTAGVLVPEDFGKVKLLGKPCWDNLFKECLRIITRYRSTRKVTIAELLT